ncbi:hypothetical protein B9Z65_8329 [Elsinoe australis]|uniref:Uncharacterized protein n=1 Tax=Elsinoe australis TaxID=40998 RepID=A0A2P7YDF6_9PEZI|nr:hypothetical protein B9Z65_8329 [Elsinoe australis]
MGTTEDRKEHFAKKRLTFLLATFIIGVLCSTHPRKYFKDAEYGHRFEETSQDNSKKRSKKKKHKHKQSARAEEDSTECEEWNPPKKDTLASQILVYTILGQDATILPGTTISDNRNGLAAG